MCWLMLVSHGKYSWNEDEREPGECGSIGRGIRGIHGAWQDQCQGAANPGLGIVPCWDQLCQAEDGIPTSVSREDKHHIRWKAGNRIWKIPEQSTLINSPVLKVPGSFIQTSQIFKQWNSLGATRFPLQPGDPGSVSLVFSGLEFVPNPIPVSFVPGAAEFSSQGLFWDAAIPG